MLRSRTPSYGIKTVFIIVFFFSFDFASPLERKGEFPERQILHVTSLPLTDFSIHKSGSSRESRTLSVEIVAVSLFLPLGTKQNNDKIFDNANKEPGVLLLNLSSHACR